MSQLLIQCKNCEKIFSSGINMGIGSSATFVGSKSKCPFCGSWENIPDGTFKATFEGFTKIIEQSNNPLGKARELLDVLEKNKNDLSGIKNSSKFLELKKWLPDSPKKVLIYIVILRTIIQLLSQKTNTSIDYDNFVNQYNINCDQVINAVDYKKDNQNNKDN